MGNPIYAIVNESGHYFHLSPIGGDPEWSDNIGHAWIYRTELIAQDVARIVHGKAVRVN